MSDKKQQETPNELAEERTEWAEDRTVLANERTYAGWMRTGLGSVGIALGLQAVFRATEPTWLAKVSATLFIAIGIAIFQIASYSSRKMLERLHTHDAEPMSRNYMTHTANAFTAAAVVVSIVLWLA